MSSDGLFMHWEGKKLYKHSIPTPRLLDRVPELSVGDDPRNRIIEGDNLQVLVSLRSQFEGQVDVVYVDPPYNLGKDDFRYSDKRFHDPDADSTDALYVSNEDGGRHTKWLNTMAPRFWMLKQMLHPQRGVLFVSINDVELFRLGMLLDEIFGETNRVGIIVWKQATDNNPTNIATEHEYILCYARDKKSLPSQWASSENDIKQLMLDEFSRIKAESKNLAEAKRKFSAWATTNKDILGDLYRYRRIDEKGLHVQRRNLDNPGKEGYKYDVIHPVTSKPCRMPMWGWRFPEERMQELISQGRIWYGKDEKQIPQLKVYLEEIQFPLRSVIHLDARAGSNDLEALFGTRDKFKNPKPVSLIELLLSYTTKKDQESLILDAFAGSGTTGEAALRLNHRDGGNRRFILIEEGEPDDRFCRTLTAERIKRAIEKYGYDGGFDFYTTGRKLNRQAIVSLERDALASVICQADELGRGKGIVRLTGCGFKYLIGKTQKSEGICLVWNGEDNSEVTPEHLREAAQEVAQAGLKYFRVYGTFCRIRETQTWKFCQIPDEILAQMHLREDLEEEEDA